MHLCSTVQNLSWPKQGQQVSKCICQAQGWRCCSQVQICCNPAMTKCRSVMSHPCRPSMAESLCGREGQSAGEEPLAHFSFLGIQTEGISLRITHWTTCTMSTESKWCFVLRERGKTFLLCFQKGPSEPMWQASCLAALCAIS